MIPNVLFYTFSGIHKRDGTCLFVIDSGLSLTIASHTLKQHTGVPDASYCCSVSQVNQAVGPQTQRAGHLPRYKLKGCK